MSKLVYAAFTDGDGERRQGLYSYPELFAATFPPDTVIHYETRLNARSMAEARDLAIDIMDADADTVNAGGELLSWNELAIISNALEKLARRFGLVREFRENGII